MKVDPTLSFPCHTTTEKQTFRRSRTSSSPFSVETLESFPSPPSLSFEITQALLNLQESLSGEEHKKKIVQKGKKILDLLSQIQSGFLRGEISPAMLRLLQDTQNLNIQGIEDPFLRGILEEIEMRSLVVLTQLEMAFQKSAPI